MLFPWISSEIIMQSPQRGRQCAVLLASCDGSAVTVEKHDAERAEYQRWLALQVRSQLKLSVVVPVVKYFSIKDCLFLLLNSIGHWPGGNFRQMLNNYICRIMIPKNFSLTTTFFFSTVVTCTVQCVLYAVWMLNSRTYGFCRNSFCQAERQT